MDTNLPIGAQVSDDNEATYTIVEFDPHDSEHVYANERFDGDVFYAEDSGGASTYFTPSEFANGSVRVVSTPAKAAVSAPEGSDQQDWNYDLLDLAASHARTVSFRYVKASGEIADRRLRPESFHTSQSGDQSVIGYDPDREGVRAYRLDRIKGSIIV